MSFAKRLTVVREKAGISMYALAAKAGLSRAAVGHLENGIREPSWITVQRLRLALGCNFESLADPTITIPDEPDEPPRRGRPPKGKP